MNLCEVRAVFLGSGGGAFGEQPPGRKRTDVSTAAEDSGEKPTGPPRGPRPRSPNPAASSSGSLSLTGQGSIAKPRRYHRNPISRGILCQKMTAEELLELIRDNPQKVRERDGYGYLPLHYAAQCGAPLEVVSRLVQLYFGAVNAASEQGWLPLHAAAAGGAGLDVVKLLVKRNGGALDLPTSRGWLPLHLAASASTLDVVAFLATKHRDALWAFTQDWERPVDTAENNADERVSAWLERAMRRHRPSDDFAAPKPHDGEDAPGPAADLPDGPACEVGSARGGPPQLGRGLEDPLERVDSNEAEDAAEGEVPAGEPPTSRGIGDPLEPVDSNEAEDAAEEEVPAGEPQASRGIGDPLDQGKLVVDESKWPLPVPAPVSHLSVTAPTPKTKIQVKEEMAITGTRSWLKFWKKERQYLCNIQNKGPVPVLVVAVPRGESGAVQELRTRLLDGNKADGTTFAVTGRPSCKAVREGEEFRLSVMSKMVEVYLLFPVDPGRGLYRMSDANELNVETSNLTVRGTESLDGLPVVEVALNADFTVTMRIPTAGEANKPEE